MHQAGVETATADLVDGDQAMLRIEQQDDADFDRFVFEPLLEELQALGVAFVSLAEGIDATTPAGKLQMHLLGAIAEFERERIRERVMA